MHIKEEQQVLRAPAQSRLEGIGNSDILVGIPSYNNEASIAHVVQTVSEGLAQYHPDRHAVILVADGGSTDDTRERAAASLLPPQQEEIVTIYRGIGGKGSALRAIFAAAVQLGASACISVDADLRSITPAWISYLLEPLLVHDYEFVAPLYARYKYDGTITNNLVYCLTRALYGKRIRQPIGGDFAFSQRLARHFLEQPGWTTDVARFGIDIWMTLGAMVAEARVCQTNLGVKLHDAKDPGSALGPMFEQVCGTLFAQIDRDAHFWSKIQGSEPIPTFGLSQMLEPEPIAVNQVRLVQEFKQGFQTSRDLYRLICSEPVFQALQKASESPPDTLQISGQVWARLLCELLATYHQLGPQRSGLLPHITPLYMGQVASFMNQTRDLDFYGAEAVVDALAHHCEREKPYLLDLWKQHLTPSDKQIAGIQKEL